MTKTVATSSVVSNQNAAPVTVPKRRGRKPNILKQQELEKKQENEGSLSPVESSTTKSTTVGRKKKSNLKYSTTSKKSTDALVGTENVLALQENSEQFVDQQNTPLILHLNVNFDENHFSHPTNECFVSNKSYETDFYEYNPELKEPIAYEDRHSDKFQSTPENYKIIKHPSSNYNSTSIDKYFNKLNDSQNIPNMVDDALLNTDDKLINPKKCDKKCTQNSSTNSNIVLLKDMMINEEWCDKTNYWCYWDCHPFENKPFGIPIKYNNGKFHVYGCFCSMECAVAYNFYANENMDNVWENFNLLNMMSNMMSYKLSLNPAISRKCLNVFGGPLTIEQFREKSINNNKFNILTYPMVSIVEHVEEINESSSYDTKINGFIPLDRSRVSKLEDTNRMNDSSTTKSKTVLEETMKLKFTY